jgi:hypothetical protein
MVEVSLAGDRIHFDVKGLDKLWAFQGRLEIPIAHIRGVHADPNIARGWWKGLKAPGTSIPGVIRAGTFYQDGKRVFWDVHDPDKTVVIDLHDERYDQLIIEVTEPSATVAQISTAIASQ